MKRSRIHSNSKVKSFKIISQYFHQIFDIYLILLLPNPFRMDGEFKLFSTKLWGYFCVRLNFFKYFLIFYTFVISTEALHKIPKAQFNILFTWSVLHMAFIWSLAFDKWSFHDFWYKMIKRGSNSVKATIFNDFVAGTHLFLFSFSVLLVFYFVNKCLKNWAIPTSQRMSKFSIWPESNFNLPCCFFSLSTLISASNLIHSKVFLVFLWSVCYCSLFLINCCFSLHLVTKLLNFLS